MSDIVERLRSYATCTDGDIDEAATEIEKLRASLGVAVAENRAWRRVDSEHRDNNPCPDPFLRKDYLDRARAASKATDADPILSKMMKAWERVPT